MAKPTYIELADETRIPILYEDRTVMALDKPAGWILGPDDWEHTARNLPLAIQSSISAGDYWARSRNMRYLRHVHRLDAGTSGILLCVKHLGAMAPISRLFADRVVIPAGARRAVAAIGHNDRESRAVVVDAR